MSVNTLQSISNNRSRNSQAWRNSNDADRVRLFRKKSIILKRTTSIVKLCKDPLIKNQDPQSPRDVNNVFSDNLKKYTEQYKTIMDDLDFSNKMIGEGLLISRKRLSNQDMIKCKTKHQMGRNNQIQRERMNYNRCYNLKFQNDVSCREWKSNRYQVQTTAVTLSTIERNDPVKLPKTALLSMLENKAKQFDARYSNILDLPKQIENQQVFIERKKSHFAYVRHRQTKSSMNSHYGSNSNNTNYKISNEMRMIERYTREQTEFTQSIEREKQRRKEREREKQREMEMIRQRKRQIEDYKSKVFISKSQLKECTFPLEASRCHSLKKTLNSILILQQL